MGLPLGADTHTFREKTTIIDCNHVDGGEFPLWGLYFAFDVCILLMFANFI